jgi:anti-sigma factor RsiW
MFNANPHLSMRHISNEDLVRSADGELSPDRAANVNAHLEECWSCRTRMAELQSAITGFVRSHHAEFDGRFPPSAGPRALLQARLAQLAAEQKIVWWRRVLAGVVSPRAAAVALPLVAIAMAIFSIRQLSRLEFRSLTTSTASGASPDRGLTPGATRQVTLSEVCSAQEEVIGDVSNSLRQQVLEEYKIVNARPDEYEIDYLIAPGLGGTEDIRNLWPEPYQAQPWNARVKDALEQRLHEMVCNGKLDLHTAQRDIATDWIAAYKKYFHTDKPLPLSS